MKNLTNARTQAVIIAIKRGLITLDKGVKQSPQPNAAWTRRLLPK
jgi:hypothetical protein